jgi:hypothetical protein
MEWEVDFGKKRRAAWIAPGYHGYLKRKIRQTITTKNGVRARVIKVEFQVQWNRLHASEKQALKSRYGADVKQQYHQYTRATLERITWIQPRFPAVEWI